MVCFQTKNPNLGKFWRVSRWKILVYFMTIWFILRPFEVFYGPLVYFLVIWYILPRFGTLEEEKSGNPGCVHESLLAFFALSNDKMQTHCWSVVNLRPVYVDIELYFCCATP
jgi:hypothetical protein